jgi:hypothetical protein
MVVNPLLDDCITGLPIDHSLETRWLRASHNTHQNQTRMGLHEEIPCLQQEINQDTSGVPLYLKRKLLLMHHDGKVYRVVLLMGFRKEVDRQAATDSDSDKTSRTNCNCKASRGKMAILSDTSTVSDEDGDWIHSDYSHDDDDEDEDEAQRQPELGVEVVGPSRRNGEFPPRIRWLRKNLHLHLLMTRRRMATMKCALWRHNDDRDGTGKVTAVPAVQLARAQIQLEGSPPRHSRKRKRNDTETETALVRSKSYNRNSSDNDDLDESTTSRKRQRLGSCHGTTDSAPAIIRRIEEGLGGLPANADGACEVAAPPITITGHLSEASALSVGPRRSQRIRGKLGSACGTTRMS